MGIGVDELVKQGMLEHLLPGPLYWIDTADSQPCIGTGGIVAWSLTAYGKIFHSGLPHKSGEVGWLVSLLVGLVAGYMQHTACWTGDSAEWRCFHCCLSRSEPH